MKIPLSAINNLVAEATRTTKNPKDEAVKGAEAILVGCCGQIQAQPKLFELYQQEG